MARRTRTEHLEYRRSGYFWRRRIPAAMRFDLKKVFCFSLRTHEASLARELAVRVTALTNLAIDCSRIRPMQPMDMQQIITALVRWNLDEADRSRRFGSPRSREAALREQARYSAACETLKDAILLRNYEALRDPIRHTLAHLGKDAPEGSELWQEIGHEVAHALYDTTREIAGRDRGEFSVPSLSFRSLHQRGAAAESGSQSAALGASDRLGFLSCPPAQVGTTPDPAAHSTVPGALPDERQLGSAPVSMPREHITAPALPPETPGTSSEPGEASIEPLTGSVTAEPDTTRPGALPPIQLAEDLSHPPEPVAVLLAAPASAPQAESVAQASRPENCPQEETIVAQECPAPIEPEPPAASPQERAAAVLGLTTAEIARCNLRLGDPGIKFDDIADAYLEERRAGKSGKRLTDITRPGGRSDGQMENEVSTVRLLKHFLPGKSIVSITETELAEIFEVVQSLPSNYGRSRTETRHPREIASEFRVKQAARAAELEAELKANKTLSKGNREELLALGQLAALSVNTVYRKMQEAKRIFAYAKMHRHILFNPMDNVIWSSDTLRIRLEAEGDRTRQIWGSKLDELFATERFRDWTHGPTDALVWAVLIAVHTGARMEEILQISRAITPMGWVADDMFWLKFLDQGTDIALMRADASRRQSDADPSCYAAGRTTPTEVASTASAIRSG